MFFELHFNIKLFLMVYKSFVKGGGYYKYFGSMRVQSEIKSSNENRGYLQIFKRIQYFLLVQFSDINH